LACSGRSSKRSRMRSSAISRGAAGSRKPCSGQAERSIHFAHQLFDQLMSLLRSVPPDDLTAANQSRGPEQAWMPSIRAT
jgi:hypothetical protein